MLDELFFFCAVLSCVGGVEKTRRRKMNDVCRIFSTFVSK